MAPITAPGFMHFVCRLLLAAVLCLTGCDRGKKKGKTRLDDPGDIVLVGKLVITPPAMETARGSAQEANEGYIEQQVGALRGAEIRQQAENFLKNSRPELAPAPVELQVERVKGSNIISVIGRGESPDFSGALVDAVMEAYVAFVNPAETEKGANPVADKAAVEKNLQEAERAWTAFQLEHNLSRLKSDLTAAERRQKKLAVAMAFYEQELDLAGKLSLEQDIRRRQAASILPPDMPAELAALVRTTLTVGELAYLSALTGKNAPVTEAAKVEAEKDRAERTRSFGKQKEIAADLTTTTAGEITRLQALQVESARLQSLHQAAEAAYIENKSRERNLEPGLNNSVRPMVSITERAGRVRGG